MIIRTEDGLPRDVVKHLQRIEEQILESRAWTGSSPLWDAIAKDPNGVPSCEEVSLPGQQGAAGPATVAAMQQQNLTETLLQSPVSHHKKHFTVARCKCPLFHCPGQGLAAQRTANLLTKNQ